jgi:hypothetical protein
LNESDTMFARVLWLRETVKNLSEPAVFYFPELDVDAVGRPFTAGNPQLVIEGRQSH